MTSDIFETFTSSLRISCQVVALIAREPICWLVGGGAGIFLAARFCFSALVG